MNTGDFAIIAILLIRSLLPLLILRKPLLGGILAMFADGLDIVLLQAFGYGFLTGLPYQVLDKTFDTWYLFLEFIVVRRWTDNLAKGAGSLLFIWRFLGVVTFFTFKFWNPALLYAPNIFEFFFLAMLIIWKFKPEFKTNWKNLTIILLIVGVPNLIKEYLMHYKYPKETWYFFRDHVFWWLYN